MAEIKSIASFIPRNRLDIEELVTHYHQSANLNYKVALRIMKETVNRFRGKALRSVRWVYRQRLLLREKIVPGPNEDALTAGIQSLNYAIKRADIDPSQIDALFVVSESYPYAVKSSTAIAGKAGLNDLKFGVRGEFACKPFGEFLEIGCALIDAGRCRYVAVTATDASQGAPGDDLEFSASFYSTTIILGKEDGIAEFKGRTSINYDFSDFVRKEGLPFPEHEGQGTSLAFRGMILSTIKKHMERYNLAPDCLQNKTWVIHSPNGSFPNEALLDISNYFGINLAEKRFDDNGKMLGITPTVKVSNLAPMIANGYSATVPTALCNAMETASKDDEIIAVFYGSGAGSDVISIKLKANGAEIANNEVPTVQEQIEYKQKISVDEYIKFRDTPDQAAKHIALLEVEPISKEFYQVEGCPECGAVYFMDSWTQTNFPDFAPPKKFKKLKGHCLRGIQKESADAKQICGVKLEKVKIPKRALIKKVEFYGPKKTKKQIGHPESPYWTMFDHKMVRGFNYNPKICNFTEGEEVKTVIGRWRPAPKGWVPLLYVPMYTHLRRDYTPSN
jgi:hydroxymethylglutaryl-CoA synthase